MTSLPASARAALRKQLEAITPWPWLADCHRMQDYGRRSHAMIWSKAKPAVCPIAAVVVAAEGCDQAEGRATAQFIAAAPSAVAGLLSEIERMERENAELRKALSVTPTMIEVGARAYCANSPHARSATEGPKKRYETIQEYVDAHWSHWAESAEIVLRAALQKLGDNCEDLIP